MTALVLYHYLYPEDVVSSVLFTDLCAYLASRGWKVFGSAANRGWHDENAAYPLRAEWKGVQLRRIWRPRFSQASGMGRIVNAIWMIAAWSLLAFDVRIRADVLVIGTDPILSVLIALPWKVLRPGVRIVHWCFDLYPEAAVAAGLMKEESIPVRLFRRLLVRAYACCDRIVDIGQCMRRLLDVYGAAQRETICPWALAEPESPAVADPVERKALFGDAAIGVLYSGSFGRAHSWDGIAELAKKLRAADGKVVFSVQGNAVDELRKAMKEAAAPVEFAGFARHDQLDTRLAAADVHIVSLREEWTGTVVPSKFFGALAIGRPVLFIGSRDSAIARWIEEFRVGWVLTDANMDSVIADMVESLGPRLFAHCHRVYGENFSRERALDRWSRILEAVTTSAPIHATTPCSPGPAHPSNDRSSSNRA